MPGGLLQVGEIDVDKLEEFATAVKEMGILLTQGQEYTAQQFSAKIIGKWVEMEWLLRYCSGREV